MFEGVKKQTQINGAVQQAQGKGMFFQPAIQRRQATNQSGDAERSKVLPAPKLTHILKQNQGEGSFLQRQDVKQDAQVPLGPIGQAKADCVAALTRTSGRLQHAIYNRDQGIIIPHDVDDALTRFFPGTQYTSFEDLQARIEPMIEWLPNIQIKTIPPIPANDIAIIKKVHNKALAAKDPPAFAVAPGLGSYIAVYPTWYADPLLQATRLLHEAYHYSFPFMRGHPKNKPWDNSVAFQGFVSVLGGLPIGDFPDKQYPPLR